MNVIPLSGSITGVPNYYKVYALWLQKYEETGSPRARMLAHHYARVAAEMGQAEIDEEDDVTLEVTREKEV